MTGVLAVNTHGKTKHFSRISDALEHFAITYKIFRRCVECGKPIDDPATDELWYLDEEIGENNE